MAASDGHRRVAIPARARRWLPALLWAGVIFVGSSMPGDSMPGGFSVQGHLVEYAILGALVLFAMPAAHRVRPALLALAICAAYALTDEVHQVFVPGRVPDPADLGVDAIGSSVGIAATVALRRWRASRRRD